MMKGKQASAWILGNIWYDPERRFGVIVSATSRKKASAAFVALGFAVSDDRAIRRVTVMIGH